MKKDISKWSVEQLHEKYQGISFPEYQREPNVWSLLAKQRLIDSMVRQFDISALYFYRNDDDTLDCVDGRQRIGAIMSFVGENDNDSHNEFPFRVLNEVYEDDEHPFATLSKKTYAAIRELSAEDASAKAFVEAFYGYEITAVVLSDSKEASEFNLQFTRLNLGTIINSGEKLNAMVGELRDLCFGDLREHPFLEAVRIPARRFSRQQLAAQIVAQVFSLEEAGVSGQTRFTRTRHFDLQRLFKVHARLRESQTQWIGNLREVMTLLAQGFRNPECLRSRAMVVSTVLLAYELREETWFDASELAEFVGEFVKLVREQVKKGLDYDREARHYLDFQKHVTQASVEPRAVEQRAIMLRAEFERWRRRSGC